MPKDEKVRRRMVVEEVGSEDTQNNSDKVEDTKNVIEEFPTLNESGTEPENKSEITEVEISNLEETPKKEDVEESVEQKDTVNEPVEVVMEDTKPESEMPAEDHFSIQKPSDVGEVSFTPELKSASSINPLVIIVPGIFLLGALLGGIYFYQKRITSNPSPSPTATLTVVTGIDPTPTSTPSVAVDLTKYPINIMNGSGTPGEAGKVKTLAETAGFKVSKTGNAPSYDFTKTIIKAKADVPTDFLTKLSETLSKLYEIDTNQVLATSSADSVQVIVGSTKAK